MYTSFIPQLGYDTWHLYHAFPMQHVSFYSSVHNDRIPKAPVTPNGVATAFVQRSKIMSARCGIAAEYT